MDLSLLGCTWVRHQLRQSNLPQSIRDIAWKAQARLCARYRRLMAEVTVAIAREIGGFLWSIARQVDPMPVATAVA